MEPLKKEYKHAVDSLEGSFGDEGTQKVRCAQRERSSPTMTHGVDGAVLDIACVTCNAVAITVSPAFAGRGPLRYAMSNDTHALAMSSCPDPMC